jgi:hypothetical protein
MMLMWSPGVALVLRSAFFMDMAARKPIGLPSGGNLVVSETMNQRLAFLQRFTSEATRSQAVLYIPQASGWYFAYNVPHASRYSWFYAEAVRPRDYDSFLESLDRTAALITCREPGEPERPVSSIFELAEPLEKAIGDRLEPWLNEAGCRVYRIKK